MEHAEDLIKKKHTHNRAKYVIIVMSFTNLLKSWLSIEAATFKAKFP